MNYGSIYFANEEDSTNYKNELSNRAKWLRSLVISGQNFFHDFSWAIKNRNLWEPRNAKIFHLRVINYIKLYKSYKLYFSAYSAILLA